MRAEKLLSQGQWGAMGGGKRGAAAVSCAQGEQQGAGCIIRERS